MGLTGCSGLSQGPPALLRAVQKPPGGLFLPVDPPVVETPAESWPRHLQNCPFCSSFLQPSRGLVLPFQQTRAAAQKHHIPPAKQLRVLSRPPSSSPGCQGGSRLHPPVLPCQRGAGSFLEGASANGIASRAPGRRGAGLGTAGCKSASTAAGSHRSPGPARVGSAAH